MMIKENGFTLTEVLLTLAIGGIVVAFAVPALKTSLQNNTLTANTNNFVTALNLARSEATKRGQRVTVCKSADGSRCASAGTWDQGWIVFVDKDNDAQVDSGNESILRVQGALENGATLTGNKLVKDYVSFVSNGTTQTISGAFQSGTLLMCDARKDTAKAKAIVINKTGRLDVRPGSKSTMTC